MRKSFLLALLCSVLLRADERPIRVEVTPHLQLAPLEGEANVYVKTTVARSPLNRALCVTVDGPTFRSSCFDFVGLAAPYRSEWWVKGLSPGRYEAVAVVTLAGGVTKTATDTFCIDGSSGEPGDDGGC